MKHSRIPALLLAAVWSITLFSACGTSKTATVTDSDLEEVSWAELTISPSPSEEEITADTVIPTLEDVTTTTDSTDVTSAYKGSFLGTWDNEDNTLTYEFLSNENLNITDTSGNTTSYTYWFTEVGSQVQLNIFENGQSAAQAYSFTLNGSNLTLYNVDSGSAVELLVRRSVSESEAATTATAAAAATTENTATTTTEVTETTVSPSASPSASATVSASPSPSAETSATPSETAASISTAAQAALPALECAIDYLRSGGSFSSTSSTDFWQIMARYVAIGSYSSDGDYYILTEAELLSAAGEVFAGLTDIPECLTGSDLVSYDQDTQSYRLLQGELSGIDIIAAEENEDGTLTVSVSDDGNAYDYTVVLSENAIVSIVAR